MWRKIGCIALVVVAVGLVVGIVIQQRRSENGTTFGFGRATPDADAPPIFEPATRGDLAITVEATGTTEPISDIEVKSEATGRIIEMPLREGDELVEGQIIARLDQSNQLLAVRQQRIAVQRAELAYREARGGGSATQSSALQTAVASAEAGVSSAEASIRNAEVTLSQAQAEHSRFADLHARGYVTDQEVERSNQAVENARTAVDQARTGLEQARAQLENARTQLGEFTGGSDRNAVEQARLSLEQVRVQLAEAEKQLGESVVRSPINGLVLEKPVDVGDSVVSINSAFGQGTTLVKVANLSRVQVRTSVDEIDIGKIKVGQPAVVIVDAFPTQEFTGAVTNVFPQGVQLAGGGLVSFIAMVEVDNLDGLLLGNMTATVRIEAQRVDDALLVPLSATRAGDEETNVVHVLQEGEDPLSDKAKTEERQVVLGDTDFSQVVVLEGLEEGEMVKVRGFATTIQFD